ncbi:energy transducer TonB [Maribellus sp. CM-23]|uniref:energy transducer TonB n=1 Tax=Maribellus sp. CM-23 TaxID=2781026 RepID=UPI001F1ED5EF|nr:energy transducer TonB [Maribellus sp. CM-23]MCE4566536.1 energy transducer TonB [Maribellus sp. CM-23]
MERKKSLKADLEGKRNTFFLIGLVVALGLVFAAFEWTSKPRKAELPSGTPVYFVEDEIPPVLREPKEQAPEPEKPKVIELINIIPDGIAIAEDPIFDLGEPGDPVIVDLSAFPSVPADKPEEQIFVNTVEVPAEFPGGERALYKYISDHVKYPIIAQENGVQGKVYVNFVVDENGDAINVTVGRAGDASLDAEAIRVIESLPRFRPAKQGGRTVKVYYTAVIYFQLQ